MKNRPIIIAFEGLDCSFKETNHREFCKRFRDDYIFAKVYEESFPRYRDVSSLFIKKWLNGRFDRNVVSKYPKAIDSMYALDRMSYWYETDEFGSTRINPDSPTVHIFDRYSFSNAIYNPINHEYTTVEDLVFDRDTFGIPNPDIVVWMRMRSLDVLKELLANKKKKDKNELDIDLITRVWKRSERLINEQLIQKNPSIGIKNFIVIDCLYNNGRMKSREDLADEVFEKVNEAYKDLFGKDGIVL